MGCDCITSCFIIIIIIIIIMYSLDIAVLLIFSVPWTAPCNQINMWSEGLSRLLGAIMKMENGKHFNLLFAPL